MNLISRVRAKIKSIGDRKQQARYGGQRPVYPKSGDGGLKIHLGAGPINIQGWVSIDARQAPHIHLRSEGFALNEFADGAISEIYMCHVLEHFSFEEIGEILRNFRKKLKVGGVLRLSVPDFDRLVTVYQANGNNLELIKFALMGGQDYEHNFHKSVFNHAALAGLLASCGFEHATEWSTLEEFGAHLGDWSETGFQTPKGEFPISLNMKAIKAQA
ncbi:class I SAM-dependent methyltransferase [Polaromonas sp. YR568]|uniref:class I SAM-dependent methyltransferase n=1 Tax=Polaromonas sp. YR568 TaxID=1855301 RepID=UPI00398BEC27